jgi:hypothetical protein
MAARWPGPLSGYGLFALFGGVVLYALASFQRKPAST